MFENTKQHIEDNRRVYIGVGFGIVIGAVVTIAIVRPNLQIVDAIKVQINSPTTNNIVQTNLIRRGHPGNMIRCIQTGEVFVSQNRAAAVMGVNAGHLAQHLKGNFDDVKGLTFELIREAV